MQAPIPALIMALKSTAGLPGAIVSRLEGRNNQWMIGTGRDTRERALNLSKRRERRMDVKVKTQRGDAGLAIEELSPQCAVCCNAVQWVK